jgi:hypothetical protein
VADQRKARYIFFMLFKMAGGTMRGGKVVGFLRSDDGFDKSCSAGHVDEFAIPCWYLSRHLINKVLKVHPL